MKLKQLLEKRAQLVAEMKDLNEKRDFENFKVKDAELTTLETEIEAEKRMMALGETNPVDNGAPETRDYNQEIREAIQNEKELDVTDMEVEERAMGIGEASAGNTSVANVAKTTFANYIIKRLPNVSRLYASIRKEKLGSSSHSIPVQKTKLGKMVKMKEFQEYVAQNADYQPIELKAHKYGSLYVVSDELVADTGYDIRGDLAEQSLEACGETLEELIIIGDAELGIHGFNDFSAATGAKEVAQTTPGKITTDDLLNVYYALPRKYRKRAKWTFNDEMAKEIAKLKDENGRPLVTPSYNNEPFGDGSLLLGREVIVNDSVSTEGKAIFFGALNLAYLAGVRNSFTIKTSEEFGFINDTKATKVNMRLDAKKAVEEAMAYFVTTSASIEAYNAVDEIKKTK